jgi:hypothetical protein
VSVVNRITHTQLETLALPVTVAHAFQEAGALPNHLFSRKNKSFGLL